MNGPETKLEIKTRKKLLAVGEACMAVFWTCSSLYRENICQLFWVLKRRDFNFCVRITLLRVASATVNWWEPEKNSSSWILMSCQPHRVTSGQSNSGHKQTNISKLFSHMYQPSVKSIYKTNHFANLKHTHTNIRHTFSKS